MDEEKVEPVEGSIEDMSPVQRIRLIAHRLGLAGHTGYCEELLTQCDLVEADIAMCMDISFYFMEPPDVGGTGNKE